MKEKDIVNRLIKSKGEPLTYSNLVDMYENLGSVDVYVHYVKNSWLLPESLIQDGWHNICIDPVTTQLDLFDKKLGSYIGKISDSMFSGKIIVFRGED